jgi:hypothetical protein
MTALADVRMVREDPRQSRERRRALFTQEEEPTGGIR